MWSASIAWEGGERGRTGEGKRGKKEDAHMVERTTDKKVRRWCPCLVHWPPTLTLKSKVSRLLFKAGTLFVRAISLWTFGGGAGEHKYDHLLPLICQQPEPFIMPFTLEWPQKCCRDLVLGCRDLRRPNTSSCFVLKATFNRGMPERTKASMKWRPCCRQSANRNIHHR